MGSDWLKYRRSADIVKNVWFSKSIQCEDDCEEVVRTIVRMITRGKFLNVGLIVLCMISSA